MANPYHDKRGRFTTAQKAIMVVGAGAAIGALGAVAMYGGASPAVKTVMASAGLTQGKYIAASAIDTGLTAGAGYGAYKGAKAAYRAATKRR
jgi:hypothetical protein